MKTCKVCDSEKRETIEEMILKGESNTYISKVLKEMGIYISFATIGRHKLKHMPEHVEKIQSLALPIHNTKYDRIEIDKDNAIETEKFFNRDTLDAEHTYERIDSEFKSINLLTMRIVKNQLAIVTDLQEKFMKGECKYPHEQVKGMQITQDMLMKFQSFSHGMLEELKLYFEDKLPEKQKLISIQAEKAKFDLDKAKKLWITKTEIERTYGMFFMEFISWYENIPNIVELECNSSPDIVQYIRDIMEKYRIVLIDRIQELKFSEIGVDGNE